MDHSRSQNYDQYPRPFSTIEQAADYVQVSTKTIRRWIEAGDLVAHKLGRQWRISDADIHTFIRLRREP